MSTIRITALPAASAVTSDDLIPIEDSPSGTAVTQKATAAQVATTVRAVAGAYQTDIINGDSSAITINTASANIVIPVVINYAQQSGGDPLEAAPRRERALEAADGDIERAAQILAEQGLAAAAKKATKAGKREMFGKIFIVKARPARTVVKAFPVAAIKQVV